MGKKLMLGLGVVGVTALGLLLFSGTASASVLTSGGPDPNQPQPKNAAEAYSLAMNPNVTDPEYVHSLAVWLASYGQRPDWGAAAERRAVDLRAERVLAEGLRSQATETDVRAAIAKLAPTHAAYATVLATRLGVESGMAPPAPFDLPLNSGGNLHLDLSVYSRTQLSPSGGAIPVGSGSGGSTSATTTPAPPALNPTNSTIVVSPGVPPMVVTPVASSPATIPLPPAMPATATTPIAASPVAVPSVASSEASAAVDPDGTVALARMLLDEQMRPNWKYVSQGVKEWQARKGMKADGKFGVGSALVMAKDVAVLPWIRYFATGIGDGSKKAAVNDYRSRLKALALSIARAGNKGHAAALMASADADEGFGWPSKTPSASPPKPLSDEEIASQLAAIDRQLGGARA
jgi:hypothetical protein